MMGWDWNQMMPWHWGWGTGGMMLGGLGMLVFWGLLIVLVVWGARALGSGASRSVPPSGPASGVPRCHGNCAGALCPREISRDEFETIRRDSRQGSV